MPKVIAPAALHALKQALTDVFWYKKDLRSFLDQVLTDTSLVARLNWEDRKRNIISVLVDHLARDQQKYQADLLGLMESVMEMTDFSHLARLDDDGPAKAAQAKASVEALRTHAGKYAELRAEKERAAARLRQRAEEAQQKRGVAEGLSALRGDYLRLLAEPPHQRGYSLERFLPKLFDLFDLDPKASFRLVGEQIDGAFVFDSLDYLLEARWRNEWATTADFDAFAGKIGRKLDNTLGLFLSINGFSPDGISAYSGQRSVMILMDGAALMAVVDGRIDLETLLRRMRKRAAQKGEIYVRSPSYWIDSGRMTSSNRRLAVGSALSRRAPAGIHRG